jgi:DNA processing protein
MSKAHWLALASVSGLGAVTARKLIEQFGDVTEIFKATDEELLAVSRVNESMVQSLRQADPEKLQDEIYSLSQEEVDLLTWDDARFPSVLRDLRDAPLILFVRGTVKPQDENAVAIVGTRAASSQGAENAGTLARELALRGLTVVSGLAIGIDTAAHRGALVAEDGRTIALLGSGIRVIHPRENAELAQQISSHGAVLTELLPNTPPRGLHLMARDRLISGLSRAVIVVQAAANSGSLDTAERARKQERLIYAVPGSEGTEALLKGSARRLELENADFDALAEEIYTHLPKPAPISKNTAPEPKQGTLF